MRTGRGAETGVGAPAASATALLIAAALCWGVESARAEEADPPRRHVDGYVSVGGVNARNGNFALTYAAFDKGSGVPYRRTYNSLATNKGVFGLRWGSTFDTYLVVLADGRVAVRENGNGALAVYGRAVEGESAADLERKVVAAEAHRVGSWRVGFGKLPLDRSQALAVQACEGAAIVHGWRGWTRTTCPLGVQRFDRGGRLTGYDEGRGPVVITRMGGAIVRARSTDGGALTFARDARALKVTDGAGGDVVYAFDDQGRNIRMSGGVATMAFGYDGRSNMTDIGFIDTTRVQLTYDDQGRVTRKVERDGSTFEFSYKGRLETSPSTLVTTTRDGRSEATLYEFGR